MKIKAAAAQIAAQSAVKRISHGTKPTHEMKAVAAIPRNAAPDSAMTAKAQGGRRFAILSADSLLMFSSSLKSEKAAPVKKNIGNMVQMKGIIINMIAEARVMGIIAPIRAGHISADRQNIKSLSLLETAGKIL